jgi:hypothetical protein
MEKEKEKEAASQENGPSQMTEPWAPGPLPSRPWLTDPLLGAAQDEEGLNTVLLEVGVALTPTAWFHLIVPVQVVECSLGDMDASTGRKGRKCELETPSPTKTQTATLIQIPGPQTLVQMHSSTLHCISVILARWHLQSSSSSYPLHPHYLTPHLAWAFCQHV